MKQKSRMEKIVNNPPRWMKQKNIVAKKVLFWISLIILGVGFFMGTLTFLPALPVILIAIALYQDIWDEKDVKVFALVLSVIMFMVNLMLFSIPDVLFWLATFIVYSKK